MADISKLSDRLQEKFKKHITEVQIKNIAQDFVQDKALSQITADVSGITKGTKNDAEVFANILKFVGKKNDKSACSCGSGQGICCMDCNH